MMFRGLTLADLMAAAAGCDPDELLTQEIVDAAWVIAQSRMEYEGELALEGDVVFIGDGHTGDVLEDWPEDLAA